MRVSREKLHGVGCYYHLMNRVAGPKDAYPLEDVDREYGMKLIKRLTDYYLLEFISMCWMGNHFHIVLYAPSEIELPSAGDIAARHNAFQGENRSRRVCPEDVEACSLTGAQMIDISRFMKDFQQRFVFYFNRAHNRRGHLWGDRFKSTILEGRQALWTAVKYVELNPVRGGLASNPADYRHCSWGWSTGSGSHPFFAGFTKHMRRSLGDIGENMSAGDVFKRFTLELARTIAYESGLAGEELHKRIEKAARGETMPIRFLHRTRHWTDGGIIGSKVFIREVACRFRDESDVMKKRFSRGETDSGSPLYCFKRLRLFN